MGRLLPSSGGRRHKRLPHCARYRCERLESRVLLSDGGAPLVNSDLTYPNLFVNVPRPEGIATYGPDQKVAVAHDSYLTGLPPFPPPEVEGFYTTGPLFGQSAGGIALQSLPGRLATVATGFQWGFVTILAGDILHLDAGGTITALRPSTGASFFLVNLAGFSSRSYDTSSIYDDWGRA